MTSPASIATSAPLSVAPRQHDDDDPVQPGDASRRPPPDPQLGIVHHTRSRYLVVSKPADVRIDGEFRHTVEKLALAYLRGPGGEHVDADGFGVRFVQRLDYATSGVLLLGLSRAAAGVAATQFEKRDVYKEYVALVHGHVPKERNIDAPIADGLPPGSYHMQIGTPDNPGRPSQTHCIPLCHGTLHGAPITKVKLVPHSGRRHQLRVHMAHTGSPIVGDATYATTHDHRAFHVQNHYPPRMMLHARKLHVRLAVDAHLYGRKSGLRTAKPFEFDGGDPFCESDIEGLTFA